MPPQSRGTPPKPPPMPAGGFYSKSTPNLTTLSSLDADNGPHPDHSTALSPDMSGDNVTSPSEPASIEDFSLDSTIAPATSDEDVSNSEEEDDEEEDTHLPKLPSRPTHHQHSRSHTYLGPSAFAPPFYNRPPTPLPPSPSLTSLLRPTFSTQTSRPTTPDPSSDEGGAAGTTHTGAQTPASTTLTSTFRAAKPVPRASPRVPTYEYYGFTLYLTSSLAFMIYCLWAYLPSPFLHQLGIYYYPNRWWALAIPAWTVMGVVYIYVALAAWNVEYLTLPMRDVGCLVDEAAQVALVDGRGRIVRGEGFGGAGSGAGGSLGRKAGRKVGGGHSRQGSGVGMGQALDWRVLWNEGTDAVMDIPVGGVCEVLYGGRDDEEEEDDTLYK